MNKDILPVLDEISAVLKKHDMTGLIVVGNRTHTDWRMEVEASWSCAWLETDAEGRQLLRVRSKLKDYPSKEAQKETMEATIGTFVTFHDTLARLSENVTHVLVMLAKHCVGKSTTEDGTPRWLGATDSQIIVSELPALTCSTHGRSAARKRPTTNCPECWQVWKKASRERYEKRMTTPRSSGCVMRARFKE